MTGSNPLHFFRADLYFQKEDAEPANAGSASLQSQFNDAAPIMHSSMRRQPRLSATEY